MKSKLLWILSITLLLITGSAWADVTGAWNVGGIETITLSGLGREKVYVRDVFTFDEDGSFSTSEGTWADRWTQKKRNFHVDLDPAVMEEYLMDALGAYSRYATITLGAVTLNGTESKNGQKISGILKLTGKLVLNANGRTIRSRMTMRYDFSGSRTAAGTQAQSADPAGADTLLKALAQDMAETAGIKEQQP